MCLISVAKNLTPEGGYSKSQTVSEIPESSMEPVIRQLLLSSESLRFEINPSLLEENKEEGKQPLSILVTTPTLSRFLQHLIETKSLISQPDLNDNLVIEKHMGCPYWDLNFTSKYTVEVLQLLVQIQFTNHENLQIRGSLTQCFKLGGSFNNGVIILHQSSITDDLLQMVVACDKIELIIYTPQITTMGEISNCNNQKTEFSDRYSNQDQGLCNTMTLVSITLSFNRREIKQILGIGGAKLDSIRIQLKCWIHIALTPFEQYIDGNLRFVSKNNTKQDITVNGLKQNVDIAISEIYNCVEQNRSI